MAEEAVGAGRLVHRGAGMLGFAPYAARFPFETWILPEHHSSHFEDTGPAEIASLAVALLEVTRKLDAVLDRPEFNLMLMTAPLATGHLPHYHWRIELVPRLGRIAGFELGSGTFLNPVAPEEAARRLRRVPAR
jgi:UDPglucose--hexose-1-phosphate uridylyltransferase